MTAALGFVVLWCPEEPFRIGEIALVHGREGTSWALGRGKAQAGEGPPRLQFVRRTSRGVEAALPLGVSQISRLQLMVEMSAEGDALCVRNVGRAELSHDGVTTRDAVVREGETVQFGRQLLLLCVRRFAETPLSEVAYPAHDFGEPDAFGIVGESPAIRRLRRDIAFCAARDGHVLVRGPSGCGKELVARALHALSPRATSAVVARNSATIPDGLVDAELFGNAKNYPNAGMPERPGLVGKADGSTLYLDEFAELPESAQAHLLRVLDNGDYQRLGEVTPRRSNFRLVAATNRPKSAIKEDVLARMPFHIEVPGLDARREDIPLLIVHLLRDFARHDPSVAARFFDGYVTKWPRVSIGLVRKLVTEEYRTHVRELSRALWDAIRESPSDSVRLSTAGQTPPPEPEREEARKSEAPSSDLTPQRIRQALDRHNGEIEATWRELGLKNRYALRRLLTRYGIEIRRRV